MEESMSYLGEVRRTAFSSFGTAASGVLIAVFTGSLQFIRAVGRRRHLAQLGGFDDRMLRDIGLTRGDLRDASAGPLWQDPTAVLVVRSVERRAARRLATREMVREASQQDLARAGMKPRNDDLVSCG
ncbi:MULTISPECIES: DUF1127 domain-containing protein [Xanthobacteraceae]|nr:MULTISPECIES: DUF1127 domain-containing protein [Xanthobacteraceae]